MRPPPSKTRPYTPVTLLPGPLSMDVFAARLRSFRSKRGLLQAQLAEMLGVSPRVYNRWERASAVPRLDTLVRLADILQVSLDELVGRAEPKEGEVRVRNPKLHALYQQIDGLSPEDQHALVVLLDSLIKRSAMGKLLAG